MNFMQWMQDNLPYREIIASVITILVMLVFRMVMVRRLGRDARIAPELRRRWIVQVRNASVLLILLGLVLIWASQIQVVAISIIAIAAAIVIATKELIMCLTGTLVRISSRSFSLGDRIEVSAMRGDVIDQTLLTTTILEIGPGQLTHQHTGRAVVLPNSLFLTVPVINETYTDEYVLHVFMVPVKTTEDWRGAQAALLAAAEAECAAFLPEARQHMDRLRRMQGLDAPSVEPRVTLQFAEPERVNLFVRIPVPARRKGRIEQAILTHFADHHPATPDGASAEDGPV